ncbi:MAG: glycosyltransferase family 39 protein [Candidatus Rokubacteria bacterium]|nr:glycosyltransferase family 39 protein [Candidatus Rokubacteria bacterium]
MKRTSAASLALLAPLAALAAWLAWRSRGWPLVHDAPIMHYIAWRLGEGAVPYRDLFDMNFPGVYLLHRAALTVFGASDAGFRAFDLLWLAGTALCVGALVAPWGRAAAAAAGLFFAVYHLAGGAWQAGQRDFLLCPFLLLGALGVARWAEHGVEWPLLWGGAALGAGLTIKPHAALLAAALAALVAAVARRHGRPAGIAAAIFAMSALVAPMLVTLWVAARGGLAAWREIVFDYLLPFYARLGRPAEWTMWRWQVWIAIAAGVALSLGAALWRRRFTARHAAVALGLGYGVAHFAGQGKGWEYHLYPLAAFAAVALFAEVEPLVAARRWAGALPLLASVAAAAVLLGVKGAEASGAAWIAEKERRVSALVRDLAGRVGPGEYVQVLDTTEGGVHALLRLRAVQSTKFLYDFHFYHDTDQWPIHKLRADFAAEFDRRPPKFLVLFERSWPAGGYQRVDQWPSLRLRLRGYRVDRRGDGYIVYAR